MWHGRNIRPDVSLTVNSVVASQGSCTVAPGEIPCTLGSLGAGGTATVTIEVTAPNIDNGSLGSDVFVNGAEWDPTSATASTARSPRSRAETSTR